MLGRPGPRQHYDNEMDLKEIYFEIVNWIHVNQNRRQYWAATNAITSRPGFTNLVISVLTIRRLGS